jgi:hypothetical protein
MEVDPSETGNTESLEVNTITINGEGYRNLLIVRKFLQNKIIILFLASLNSFSTSRQPFLQAALPQGFPLTRVQIC